MSPASGWRSASCRQIAADSNITVPSLELERGHPPQWMSTQMRIRAPVGAGDLGQLIRLPDLLQHPQHAARARTGHVVEADWAHRLRVVSPGRRSPRTASGIVHHESYRSSAGVREIDMDKAAEDLDHLISPRRTLPHRHGQAVAGRGFRSTGGRGGGSAPDVRCVRHCEPAAWGRWILPTGARCSHER